MNKDGLIVGTTRWGGSESTEECPLAAPPGGSIMALNEDDAAYTMQSLFKGGQKIHIKENKVSVDGLFVGTISDGKLVFNAS